MRNHKSWNLCVGNAWATTWVTSTSTEDSDSVESPLTSAKQFAKINFAFNIHLGRIEGSSCKEIEDHWAFTEFPPLERLSCHFQTVTEVFSRQLQESWWSGSLLRMSVIGILEVPAWDSACDHRYVTLVWCIRLGTWWNLFVYSSRSGAHHCIMESGRIDSSFPSSWTRLKCVSTKCLLQKRHFYFSSRLLISSWTYRENCGSYK